MKWMTRGAYAVNDKQLENLLRMACEIDEIERIAGQLAESQNDTPPTSPRGRSVVADNAGLRWRHGSSRRRTWRVAVSIGALAAAACVSLLIRSPTQQRAVHKTAAGLLDIAYCPGVPLQDGQRVDRFEPNTREYCVVLAIFRSWHNGCRCLTWQLHEWEDGRTLAEVAPGEAPEIALDVTDAPPVEQLLLIAFSPHASDLPSSEDEVNGLLDCLNDITPPTEVCESADVCALAAESCLPDGVTVVPRSFFVE